MRGMENTAGTCASSVDGVDEHESPLTMSTTVPAFRRPSLISSHRRQSSLSDLEADMGQKVTKLLRFRQLSDQSPARRVNFREDDLSMLVSFP